MLRKVTRTGVSQCSAIGSSTLANAAQVRVSIKLVNDMVLLKRATGSLEARQQGNGGGLFIAALRHDRLDAPWVIGGAMNREFFDLYVETQLAPTLQKGDVAILDNLATHKSPKAAAILKDIGSWFLFLPPYSPAPG